MSTINSTGTTVTSGVPEAQIPYNGINKIYVLKNTVDLTGGAITQADVYQCLAVPEDTLVLQVKIEWLTAAVGTTLTTNIGDGDGTNSWDASVDGKSTAGTWTTSLVGTDAYAAAAAIGKFYETADTIDMVMTTATAITAGPKFTIYALCVDYN